MHLINYITVFLIIIIIIGLYLAYRRKWRRYYYLISKIPGPKGLPLIGNALDFLKNEEIANNSQKIAKKYGSVFKVQIGHITLINLANPTDIFTTLNHPGALEKDQHYLLAKSLVGNGLISAPYKLWKLHRKILNSTFSKTVIDNFLETFYQKSQILTEVMEKEVGKKTFNIHHYFDRFSMNVVCETSMGYKEDMLRNDSKIFNAIEWLFGSYIRRGFRFWLSSDFIYYKTKMGKKQKHLTKIVRDVVKSVIRNKKDNAESADINPSTKRKPFLDLVLELNETGSVFTDDEMEDEVCTLLLAGTDTVAVALSFVAVLLGIHQDVQEKVYTELNEIFGNSDRKTTLKDLQRMAYLERVIKESLRLFPPVGFILRRTTSEVHLERNIIPKDTTVVISIIVMHRNSEVWPNPNKFDPDRFLPEEIAKRHSYAYLPFGGGPRYCIGHKYAMMLIKVAISSVLRRYKITSDMKIEDIKLCLDIVMKINEGFNVLIESRK